MQGAKRASTELIEKHQARLFGYMRCRVHADAVAKDLAQDTWVEVWRRIATFDPERGSFWSFTRIWADFVLRRHWARQAQPSNTPKPLPDDDETHVPGVEPDRPMTAPARDWPVQEGAEPSPETSVDLARVLAALLARIAGCSRPPHEIIVFGFSRLSWKPSEISDELGGAALSHLEARLEEEYAAASSLPATRDLWRPLRDKLEKPLGDSIDDPRTRKLYPALLPRVAGETRLCDYFRDDTPADELVTRWWDTVKRSVFKDIRSAPGGELREWLESFENDVRTTRERRAQPG